SDLHGQQYTAFLGAFQGEFQPRIRLRRLALHLTERDTGSTEQHGACGLKNALTHTVRVARDNQERNSANDEWEGVTTFRRRSICRPDAGVPGLFGCGRANTDRSLR